MDTIILVTCWAFFAYILGCTSMSHLIAARLGISMACIGSGGSGATNLFRALKHLPRWQRFLLTGVGFAWDVAKGFLPIAYARLDGTLPAGAVVLLAGAIVLGHTFPPFYKGGKGVATGFGILLALNPALACICLASFLFAFVPTGIVTIGSVAAAVMLVILSPIMMGNWVYSLALVLLGVVVVERHKTNILRIIRDEEQPLFHWRLGLRRFPENAQHCLFFIHVPGDGPEACKKVSVHRLWWTAFLPAKLVQKCMPYMPMWLSYMGHSKGITMLNGQPIICHVIGIPYEMSAFVNPQHPCYEAAFERMVAAVAYWMKRVPEIKVIGLGAGTGITHRNGSVLLNRLAETHPNLKVTNGNTFTEVGATLTEDRLQQTVDSDRQRFRIPECKGVVGAGGSVGKKVVMRQMGNPDCSELLVVGNPNKLDGGLTTLVASWQKLNPEKPIRIVTLDVATKEAATVFLCANVASGLVINPEHCRPDLKLIDVGKPANSQATLKKQIPSIRLVAGGHVRVPGRGMGMGKIIGLFGHVVFACCAETIIHATGLTAMWRDAEADDYVGAPNAAHADELQRLAGLLGITVSQFYDPHTDREVTFTR
jgi:glycerol-3-phosphate acyltransferase PlsY